MKNILILLACSFLFVGCLDESGGKDIQRDSPKEVGLGTVSNEDDTSTIEQDNTDQKKSDEDTLDLNIPDQDVPVQDVPVQDVPVQDVPVQEMPVQELPVQELPVQDVPDQDVPDQEVPDQDVPDQDVPDQDVPDQDVPDQDVPDQEAPDQEVPNVVYSLLRTSIAPFISPINDQMIYPRSTGQLFNYQPTIVNQDQLDGIVHWQLLYAPDGMTINPVTGELNWLIEDDLASESFHIGFKVNGKNTEEVIRFIIHLGINNVVTIGAGEVLTTIKAGLKALPAGGTLVVKDGNYEGNDNYIGLTLPGSLQHPKSGTAQQLTTLMAEHIGEVTLRNGASVKIRASNDNSWPAVSYVAIKGFFAEDGQFAVQGHDDGVSITRHHHIKLINNGATGIEHDSPFTAFRSDDILFENNYAFGRGRYKFSSYQATNIVWRRNVARYDVGSYDGEPKGTYAAYTTMNFLTANNIAVDADQAEFVSSGEIAGEYTTPTTSGPSRGKMQRNIQLNSEMIFGNMDEQISNGSGGDSDVELSDMVSWDVRPISRYVMTWGSAWFDHMTMGDIASQNFSEEFFNGYHTNTRGLTNSILHNFQNGDLFYGLSQKESHFTIDRTVPRFGVNRVNISSFTGIEDSTHEPSTLQNISYIDPVMSSDNPNGALRYIVRSEANTNLADLTDDNKPLGATVMTMLGKSGAFYGAPGFDQETNIPMWPFPLEDIIKTKMQAYRFIGPIYADSDSGRLQVGEAELSGERGFAVNDQKLSHYVWNYLGSIVPPFNVTAMNVDDNIRVQWQASAKVGQAAISGYRLYAYDVATEVKGELIDSTGATTFAWQKPAIELINTEHIIVVAVSETKDSSGLLESGFSYIVKIK
jgi:hypothetical protein